MTDGTDGCQSRWIHGEDSSNDVTQPYKDLCVTLNMSLRARAKNLE